MRWCAFFVAVLLCVPAFGQFVTTRNVLDPFPVTEQRRFETPAAVSADESEDTEPVFRVLEQSSFEESVFGPAVADGVTPVELKDTPAAKPEQKRLTATITKMQGPKERWLVSETWCPNCPPAKSRFLASGGDEEHIITIEQAKLKHNRVVGAVPFEYEEHGVVTVIQPPFYRRSNRMSVTLNGSHTPTKDAILRHLRTGAPHQGRHWQAWHLESWEKEQLYALHDDAHAGKVPEYAIPGEPTDEPRKQEAKQAVPVSAVSRNTVTVTYRKPKRFLFFSWD